ncbi:hypothetical protein BC936DRAFT_141298, partial [Jimgerdemannia flammicorona]
PHPFSSAIPLRHTVLWKFQDTHARLPNPSSAEDLAALRDLRDTHLKSVGVVDPSVVSDDLVDLLALTAHAELAPVCAIVGGVLAQDVLKVLSGKELPVQNWFLYNGLDGRFVVVRGSGVRTVFWGGESKREGWRNRAHHRLFVPISRSRVGSGLIHQIEAGKAFIVTPCHPSPPPAPPAPLRPALLFSPTNAPLAPMTRQQRQARPSDLRSPPLTHTPCTPPTQPDHRGLFIIRIATTPAQIRPRPRRARPGAGPPGSDRYDGRQA